MENDVIGNRIQSAAQVSFFFLLPTKTNNLICSTGCDIVSYSNFVLNTFFFSLHPSKKGIIISPVTLQSNSSPLCYLWVCSHSGAPARSQAVLFHLNFNPIYGPSYPLACLGPSNYSSSGLHVTRPCHKSLLEMRVLAHTVYVLCMVVCVCLCVSLASHA